MLIVGYFALQSSNASAAKSWVTGKRWQSVGFLIVCLSLWLVPAGDRFLGIFAVAPVTGAIMILAGAPGNVERLLANKTLVWIGKRPYALYLWHWPVFCIIDYGWFTAPNSFRLLLKVVITAGITIASYRFFEQPLRQRISKVPALHVVLRGFAAIMVLTVVVGVWMRMHSFNHVNTKLAIVASGGVFFNQSSTGPHVVIIGDSTAGMYGKVFAELAIKENWKLNVLSVQRNDPFPGNLLWDNTIDYVGRVSPDAIVFAASWGRKHDLMRVSCEEMVSTLANIAPTIVIEQQPILPEDCNRRMIRVEGQRSFFESNEDRVNREKSPALLRSCSEVSTVPVEDLFVEASGAIRFHDHRQRQLFRDMTHLSYAGASLVGPRLKLAVKSALSERSLAP